MRIKPCRIVFAITLFTLAFGLVACAKSDPAQFSTGNQQVAASQSTASSPGLLAQNVNQTATTSGPATSTRKIDACGLLTAQEIRAIQGESLKETKPSSGQGNGLSISQCFFALPNFTNSVSLVVTQRGEGAGARDPKEFWEETFDRDSEAEREKERGKKSEKEREKEAKKPRERDREEEEEEAAPRQKIAGVGDEAFWTGSRVGGALYVLKGDAYIRVSIGGSGDQQTKINKSKALAAMALKRL